MHRQVIREATADDIADCTAVWLSTQDSVPLGPIPYQPLSAHELATGALLVAEDDGEIIGFAGTLTRSGARYLADLFVHPAWQSQGIGRELAERACVGHQQHAPARLFTFASADRRAQKVYARLGMLPVEQYHYLDAPFDAVVAWARSRAEVAAAGVQLVAAQRDRLVDLDAAITGRDRRADIDYASANGSTWYRAHRQGTVVGAAAVSPMWWSPWHPTGVRVGPVLVVDEIDLGAVLSAAVAVAAGSAGSHDVVSTFVPSSLAVLPELLEAGFGIVDTDLLMTSDPSVLDPRRYLPTVDTP